ncbi:MAG: DNA polymerase III subunit beta [Aggregatilineales bacterium]
MRVSVLQENLARGLSMVSRAIGSRPTLPILGNILVTAEDGRLRLSATNLELAIIARVGAKVDEEGAITVPARTFQDFVNALPPERIDMTLDQKTRTLKVQCGSATSNIRGISAEDYPALQEAPADEGIAIPAQAFHEMVSHVAFAAAKEDNRPVLTGVLTRFEGDVLTMAAADGYRLTVRTIQLDDPVDTPLTMIIPARTLGEMSRAIGADDTTIRITTPAGRNQVMFHLDRVDFISQLIEGQYPAIEQIIPKTHTTMTIVPTEELLKACKRAEIFARDAAYTAKFKVAPGESALAPGLLTIAAQSQETGDNEGRLDAKVSGSAIEISFNVRFLIEVLGVIKEDQVVLEMTSNANPGVVRPVNRQDFTHVLMPMATR